MPNDSLRLVCQACGFQVPSDSPLVFRCPIATEGDGADHLLCLIEDGPLAVLDEASEPNPFVAFRGRSFAYKRAREWGMRDATFVALVRELDKRIEQQIGHGFERTPLVHSDELGLWIKDETNNVAGSHKARHLFGLMLWIEVAERCGRIDPGFVGTNSAPLAIASCGNAALAAATLANAWQRSLQVFIPTWADAHVVQELKRLGAMVIEVERQADSPPGDPCVHAFRAAVAGGAIPFTCQGPENGLVIEGGKTLGYEIAQAQVALGLQFEHIFVQVGGGALASATASALLEGPHPPRIHAVQSRSCHPLVDAWRQLAGDLRDAVATASRPSIEAPSSDVPDATLANWLHEHAAPETRARIFRRALLDRSRYMRPIDGEAHSVATGILDDEAYDWFAIVRAMIETGGWPIVVDEQDLVQAAKSGRALTSINVDATGTASLAGALAARTAGAVAPAQNSLVLFTGKKREATS